MDDETKKEFENIGKVFSIVMININENANLLNQHADIINLLKKSSVKSVFDLEKTVKAMQEDMDKIFEMIHDLKNLPNILSVLQDFDKLTKIPTAKDEKDDKNEKSSG